LDKPRNTAIDIVVNPFTTNAVRYRPHWSRDFLGGKIGVDETLLAGLRPEEFVDRLEEAGIAFALLVAAKAGPEHHPVSYRLPYSEVEALVERYPTRFRGLAGIDPTEGMRGVRELERAVKEQGFVGAHCYPHWFELPPDHARYYPFYAKCVELDIPIQIQVGQCLRYSAERPLRSVGRPITLDSVACDFPDLKLIGIHIGWPWTEEMISVAYKHPNVYIGSDAYAPKYWPREFVHFVNTWGKEKVLFGSDFPVIDPARALGEIDALGLRPESKDALLRSNAIRVYRLDELNELGSAH
jgi:predicted TIM-barrel fold metal-dependent hydrolase